MKCEYCNKNLSTKQTLKRHLEICKEKKEDKFKFIIFQEQMLLYMRNHYNKLNILIIN